MKRVVKIVTFYDDGTFTESVPSAPYSPMPITPLNPNNWDLLKVCPKCGLKMDGPMGYVCNNYPCPTGLGGSWCSTNE
jgi:hypothetical protein